jgi:hypothetical protein
MRGQATSADTIAQIQHLVSQGDGAQEVANKLGISPFLVYEYAQPGVPRGARGTLLRAISEYDRPLEAVSDLPQYIIGRVGGVSKATTMLHEMRKKGLIKLTEVNRNDKYGHHISVSRIELTGHARSLLKLPAPANTNGVEQQQLPEQATETLEQQLTESLGFPVLEGLRQKVQNHSRAKALIEEAAELLDTANGLELLSNVPAFELAPWEVEYLRFAATCAD